MKRASVVFLCFSVIFSAATASVPDSAGTYLAARDRYIAAFKDLPDKDQTSERAVRARDEVEGLLQMAVPGWYGPGISSFSHMNLSCMDDNEMGFSVLDGRVYGTGKASVIVTNRALLMRWLAHRRDQYKDNVPVAIPAAFRADDFWTFSVGCDAAAQLRGTVPVTVPAGTEIAVAALGLFAQDVASDRDADTLLVAVVRGDRVFVAQEKLAAMLVRPAICKQALDQTLAKSAAALKDYQESLKGKPPGIAKDTSRFKDHIALEAKADRDYRSCFASHLREQPNYAAVQRQAQALVELLH